MDAFLTRYGLLALLALATVEGDVSLVVGGVLAHLGEINTLGCGLAAVGFVSLGFGLGRGTAVVTAEVQRLEHWLALAVVLGGLLVAAISRATRRRLDR
ncbi:MAG: hypothetical protein IPK12_18180 [Gemmatimonadetes bacterium]|nr:hypothetical protein [Gemmatimonadota bacterium]